MMHSVATESAESGDIRSQAPRLSLGGSRTRREAIATVLEQARARFYQSRANHLGYPYNLAFDGEFLRPLTQFLINNLGDPYTGSHYGTEVCGLEREVIAWLGQLWRCDPMQDYWGSVGASGTEGNLWALYLAREALPKAIMLYSQDAHYSIPKAAKILGIEAREVPSRPNGEISLEGLRATLAANSPATVILALSCGTTMKGAHDDIAGALRTLDQVGFTAAKRYVHVDGALNAMVLPFIKNIDHEIQPSFEHHVDSISTSGHKMIGTPMPCGVLIARRTHVERISASISYLCSNDTTLMGSRNGHAVVALWARLHEHGHDGFRDDVAISVQRAIRLANELRSMGVPALHNPHSLTVVFPEPSTDIVDNYQLACHSGEAHAIAMPNVSDALVDRFLWDYANWWATTDKRSNE